LSPDVGATMMTVIGLRPAHLTDLLRSRLTE